MRKTNISLKTTLSKSLFATVFISLPMLASADVTLSYKGVDHRSSFQISDGNMRMNFDHEGNQGYLLYQGAQDKVYMVNPERKQYMELDQMVKQVESLKDSLGSMFDQQMPGMSAESKEKMKNMMGGLMGGMFGDKKKDKAPEPVRIERTGAMENIAGFTCERVRVINPASQSHEVCVSTAKEVGVSSADAGTMRKLMTKMSAIGDRLSKMIGSKKSMPNFAADIDGVPVKTYDETGAELVSANFSDIKPAMMALPEGYTKASMPSLGQ